MNLGSILIFQEYGVNMTERNNPDMDAFVLNLHMSDEESIRPYIFDRKGQNISLKKWKELNDDDFYRRIGLLEIGDFTLSTMWSGIAHDGYRVFETVVFSGKDKDGFGIDPIFEEWCDKEEIAIGLHMILARSISEIYESSPSPSEKKRRVLLGLDRLQRFLHPEEPEDDRTDGAELSKPFPSETIH